MTYYDIIDSPVGQLLLISEDDMLTGLYYMIYKKRPEIGVNWIRDAERFHKITSELAAYLEGSHKAFDIAFRMDGTDFQKSVWRELLRIPYGKTVTYKEIAATIGRPAAVRAVGTAVGSNPICIVTPCHRVLPSNGKIGGYAGGQAAKAMLLTIESR